MTRYPFVQWIKPYIFFLFFLPLSGIAQFGQTSQVSLQLVSETTTLQPGQTHWLALHMRIGGGWHTYWRNPGDTGLETSIDWQLPAGISAGEMRWPVPEVIAEPPLYTFGYHGSLYYLIPLTVAENYQGADKISIKAEVNWLECKEVCLPGSQVIELGLTVSAQQAQADAQWQETFAAARSMLPLEESEWQISARYNGDRLQIEALPPEWFSSELTGLQFYPYQTMLVKYADQQTLSRSGKSYLLSVTLDANRTETPSRIEGVLVAEPGWRGEGSEKGLQINIPLTQGQIRQGTANGPASIWLALLFSFLGGIILNLMPCVLPVLSIKILGFVQQAHEEKTKAWHHGALFTGGVLASFWILAGTLLILRAGGEQLGWGFQLQSPLFLIFLSVFMLLFGLSMFGVFEIGTSLTTVANKTQGASGLFGSFISGVTATVVATPCTAPFMGSALGFALTQPAWISMTIFTFLGLGMAAPYVLLSSIPALLKFVPRPGRWMESLKQFMGFLLVATVIWLLWVLGLQAGSNVVIFIMLILLLVSVGGWIYGRWGHLAMPPKTRVIATIIAAVFILAPTVYGLTNWKTFAADVNLGGVTKAEGMAWENFDEEKIQAARAAGRAVFVDFTAAWCLSCQVNEKVAFGNAEVQQAFHDKNILPLKADWTSRDEKITRALAAFGRNSVPLYVYYPAKTGSEPVILPEIISPGIVLEALK